MRRYVGSGEYIPGTPARDLTEAEYKAIPGAYRAIADRIYEKVEKRRAKEEPAEEG